MQHLCYYLVFVCHITLRNYHVYGCIVAYFSSLAIYVWMVFRDTKKEEATHDARLPPLTFMYVFMWLFAEVLLAVDDVEVALLHSLYDLSVEVVDGRGIVVVCLHVRDCGRNEGARECRDNLEWHLAYLELVED